MRAIKTNEFRENFKEICNQVAHGETFIVARPRNENVVVVSEREWNQTQKMARNAQYLAMLDKAAQELAEGKGITKTMEELEAMTDG